MNRLLPSNLMLHIVSYTSLYISAFEPRCSAAHKKIEISFLIKYYYSILSKYHFIQSNLI